MAVHGKGHKGGGKKMPMTPKQMKKQMKGGMK